MDNNMIVKLKIPAEVRFECPTCFKSFSSGQGLGGHKRIHMDKKRNHEATVDLLDGENGDKTLFSCPVCPQGYASEKALHGHMRKHPDRGWRGMRPPPPPPEAEAGSQPLDHQASTVANDRGKYPLLVSDNGEGPIIKSQKKFSCEKCGKSYKSYQALGGHKSHHEDDYAPHPRMEQSEGFVGISGHGGMPQGGGEKGNGDDQPAAPRVVFDFDLNELPKW